MNNRIIRSPWVIGNLSLRPGNVIHISIVVYEHLVGLPARFCAGLVPAVDVSRQLKQNGFKSVVRVIDPTPIADYCNGWQLRQTQFRDVVTDFFNRNSIAFFFDEAERVDNGATEILMELGGELESAEDEKVADMVRRIKASGRRHGGNSGMENASLYMAAHPFSWLDMHHPLIWKKSYPSAGHQFVNLMSTSEERFAVVRRFLQARRPDLCTDNHPIDRFMAVCNTPCYIPLGGEPMMADLSKHGHNWCCERYRELAIMSSSYARASKDFEVLSAFNC